MYISLSEMKEHLLLDDSFTSDDKYIASLIDIAEVTIANYTGVPQLKDLEINGLLPSPLVLCIKFLVTNFYEHRETLSEKQLYKNVYALDYLLLPYCKIIV